KSRYAVPGRAFRGARLDHPPDHAQRAAAYLGSRAQDDSLRDPRYRGIGPARRPRDRNVGAAGQAAADCQYRYPPSTRYQLATIPRAARRHLRGDRPRSQDMSRRWESIFWPLLAATLFLALWHTSVIVSHTRVFPAPLDVLKGLRELVRKGVLLSYIGDSLLRVGVG